MPRHAHVLAVLVPVLLGSLSGCGGDVTAPPPAAVTEPAAVDTEPSASPIRYGSEAADELGFDPNPWAGDLDGMVERRIIRVLTVYSKTYYFLDGIEQRGTVYEFARLFEDWVNEELDRGTLRVHVMLIPVTRDRLLPALVEGYGDIATGGLTITPERQELVAFSTPSMTDIDEIVVTGPRGPVLTSLDDLAGQEIYVRASSSYYDSLQTLNARFEARGLDPIDLVLAEEYLEDEDLLEMVDAGLVPTVVVDAHKATFWDQMLERITLHPDLVVRQHGSIATAFRQNSPQLADLVNRFTESHREGTLLGNVILNRYLEDTSLVRDVFSDDDRSRFDATLSLFETYASRYAFDPLMIVAQGYQESRLDQSLVSPAGAIGIMQLLPSTAADEAVGIPDIRDAENNIHAGIRYMRWIRETYFQDETVDAVNKTLFSFASYNGGPNRIERLRAQAAERGLDPNVWFRNVEIMAAEAIGQETVQYVSNIYKYYAAYRLLAEREARRQQALPTLEADSSREAGR